MTLPVTDKVSTASSTSPSPAVSERLQTMASDGPDSPTGVKTIYLALLKSVDYEAILAHYQAVRGGAKEGDVALSNQFARIFEEARTRTVVASETFARYAPGVGYFTTSNADDAEALASEMIRVAASQNTAIPILELHKNFLAVIVTAPMAEDGFTPAHELIEKAEALAGVTASGEVRVSDAVYRSLSPERRGQYERVTGPEGAAAGPLSVSWRRKAVLAAADTLPLTVQRAVMVVDMARFSRIQANMKLMYRESGASTLSNQIVGIISGGFESAGASSYELYMHKWGGDGGIFLFDDPALAHRVSIEILKQAEERHNREGRENNCDDAMRCFRIGIDFGRLDRGADRKEYAGEAITRATRLESGGPSGEIRVTEEFYARLSEDLRRAYGGKQPIFGKDHDQAKGIPSRRLKVGERAPWTEVGRDNKPFGAIEPNGDFPDRTDVPALEQCFVICPLGDDQPRVADVFDRLIVPGCARAAFTARRATDLPGDRKTVIAEQLWNSPLVIAYLGDPARWNHNVILEVGIRLATGLPLIIMSDALEDGREPDYQNLLPFQIVHQNVITVGRSPEQKTQKLIEEISNGRARTSGAWESPNPVIEFRYSTFDEIIITDANEPARTVFGADVVRKGQTVDHLRKYLLDRCDPQQAAARSEEQMALLDSLLAHSIRGRLAAKDWKPPRARIPIVLKDAAIDPATGKPVGYLPIVLRYHFDQQFTRVRYLYLRVSAAMKKDETAGYYVCDI
jgi:class 3 adenylate cyclase